MSLLLGSLFMTRARTNRWWTVTLELLVAVHGTLVAARKAPSASPFGSGRVVRREHGRPVAEKPRQSRK
ncbi:hypothetical protein [Streptosporangium sp. LJ11]|uniref:hypothetical protein n=1 Tax=Streptosporangium sp. LJ11 TaxID=3436927 RepID=UPI003F7A0808